MGLEIIEATEGLQDAVSDKADSESVLPVLASQLAEILWADLQNFPKQEKDEMPRQVFNLTHRTFNLRRFRGEL